MRELLGIAITKHAKDQMAERNIGPDLVALTVQDFDCFRVNACEQHHYLNLWRGPVRVTLALDPECWTIVTVAWTDHVTLPMAFKEAV